MLEAKIFCIECGEMKTVTNAKLVTKQERGKPSQTLLQGTCPNCKSIISRVLERKPARR